MHASNVEVVGLSSKVLEVMLPERYSRMILTRLPIHRNAGEASTEGYGDIAHLSFVNDSEAIARPAT